MKTWEILLLYSIIALVGFILLAIGESIGRIIKNRIIMPLRFRLRKFAGEEILLVEMHRWEPGSYPSECYRAIVIKFKSGKYGWACSTTPEGIDSMIEWSKRNDCAYDKWGYLPGETVTALDFEDKDVRS